MLLRLLSTALCATCVVLLITDRPVRLVVPRQPSASVEAPMPVSVVDIAAGMHRGDLPALIRIRPGERVIAINDQPVAGNLEAGAEIVWSGLKPGGFLDVAIAGGRAERRVLMLMH
jgi:hypothetical protein